MAKISMAGLNKIIKGLACVVSGFLIIVSAHGHAGQDTSLYVAAVIVGLVLISIGALAIKLGLDDLA